MHSLPQGWNQIPPTACAHEMLGKGQLLWTLWGAPFVCGDTPWVPAQPPKAAGGIP